LQASSITQESPNFRPHRRLADVDSHDSLLPDTFDELTSGIDWNVKQAER
jgi:hypothetical protein